MWIVNQHGVIHEIPDDRPAPKGSRPATAHEVAEWRKRDLERKAVSRDAKQAARVASAKFVVQTGGPQEVDDRTLGDVEEYRADPANPNVPLGEPKPTHSPRPAVYPPTNEPYNPLTGLPYRADPGGPRPPDPVRDTENIPYDPATGDYLRVTPASPLDPTIQPPDGQPGGKPPGADVDAAVTPGEPIQVVTSEGSKATIATTEGGTANDEGKAQEKASKDATPGAIPPKGKK